MVGGVAGTSDEGQMTTQPFLLKGTSVVKESPCNDPVQADTICLMFNPEGAATQII